MSGAAVVASVFASPTAQTSVALKNLTPKSALLFPAGLFAVVLGMAVQLVPSECSIST